MIKHRREITQNDNTANLKDNRIAFLKERIKISVFVALLYLLLSLLHVGCPIKYVSGISCPGCGMTRAWLSLLHLDFRAAFHFHPLFIIAPILIFLFLFEAFIKPKYYKLAMGAIISLFLVVYIIRLIFNNNEIVNIDIRSGIVIKLIYHIIVGGFK